VFSLLLSHAHMHIYVYLRSLNNASVGLGSYASVWCGACKACEPGPTMNPKRDQPSPNVGQEGSTLGLTTIKPRTSPESQPGAGFTGASKKNSSRRDSEGITGGGLCYSNDFITEMPTLGLHKYLGLCCKIHSPSQTQPT
jgi:hypothetical protein